MMDHLSENYGDATHVIMNECNPMGCAQVSGVNDHGQWGFTEGPEGETHAELLMVEHDDCE